MEQKWIQAERHLWDAVMTPRRRRHSLHGLTGEKRTKAVAKNRELAEKEFAAEWAALHALLEH